MQMKIHRDTDRQPTRLRYYYWITVFFLALTGFGQMPIYKRYYMADLPAMGWLADFYITRLVHYLGAAALLALIGYQVVTFLFDPTARRRITGSGYLRIFLLGGILFTGILFVIKNFPGYYFTPGFIIGLDLAHIGFVMLFLFTSLYCALLRKRWTSR